MLEFISFENTRGWNDFYLRIKLMHRNADAFPKEKG